MQSVVRYFEFIFLNRRFLGYGLLMSFGSSFGQTYFISLFSAEIRGEYGLSHGGFGALYSAATMFSAISLVWLGRKVDTLDLRLFSLGCTIGLVVACVFLSWSSNLIMLAAAIYLLRLNGQGLMTHASMTSMARYYDKGRGRALSIASLGFPMGEAILPLVAVSVVAFAGWRETWILIAGFIALIIVPTVQWLLRTHGERDVKLKSGINKDNHAENTTRDWSRRDILKDIKFYYILPAVLAPSFICTGIFFHQIHIVEVKGWELSWFASCFIAYALCQLLSSVIAGPLVDRVSAKRLLPFFLIPLIAGLTVLSLGADPMIALIFMMLAGLTSGASSTIAGALWAEVYGITHLGAIRAMVMALMVCSSALSPIALGWFIDIGTSINTLTFSMALYALIASVLAIRISGRRI